MKTEAECVLDFLKQVADCWFSIKVQVSGFILRQQPRHVI